MAFNTREDQTAPVDRERIMSSAGVEYMAHQVVENILYALNERRDSYDGIVSSIRWVIAAKDHRMLDLVKEGLIRNLTSNPMSYCGRMFISKIRARLVDEEPTLMIELFERIILDTDWCEKFSHRIDVLRLQIIALKTITEAEQKKNSRQTTIDKEIRDKLCNDAIHNGDDSTKIDTLSLILESRSTTKPLADHLLVQFEVSFRHALSLQEPALRQMFLSQTNKLLRRLNESHRVVLRDKKLYSDEQRTEITARYMSFLTWLIKFCFDSIYCNAYFGSFILTISTLSLIIKHIGFSNQELPIETLFNSKRCYDSVLSCLNDSFEENKSRSLNLLSSLPPNNNFLTQENLDLFENLAYRLAESVNPAHSLTCQYLFKLIVELNVKINRAARTDVLYNQLDRLTKMVEEGLSETKTNCIFALRHKPIYPKLSCIRALLDGIQAADIIESRDRWRELAERIIKSSIDACGAVSNIVCNLNPETIGHLPMDLKPVDADTLSKTMNTSLKINESDTQTISSQMLLISGWKTIKECSLSMGAMVVLFWWPSVSNCCQRRNRPVTSYTEPIIGEEHITKILSFFDHYLRNLRHRGAFEQAYNGFMIVTRRVWDSNRLQESLIRTLEDIMCDFERGTVPDDKKVDCLKAYVTRRSAGLPFIVQAILNAEGKNRRKIFDWIMDKLISILQTPEIETYKRIHCLNILRALVKEHSLGDKVKPYIGRTFSITLDCFESDHFPVRNCANMLLKAIVDRTFGVNRLRNDIHRKNQLSFERFFQEFPKLRTKMLVKLHNGLEYRKYLAAVHSVFIILFRLVLFPNTDKKLSEPFIQPLERLAITCPDYKLRDLAAKLNIKFTLFRSDLHIKRSDFIRENLLSLNQALEKGDDFNVIHGHLTKCKYLVESRRISTSESWNYEMSEYLSITIPTIISRIYLEEMDVERKKDHDFALDWPIKSVAMDLAESYCLNFSDKKFDWLPDLVPVLEHYASSSSLSLYSGQQMYENFLFKLSSFLLIGLIGLKLGHFSTDGFKCSCKSYPHHIETCFYIDNFLFLPNQKILSQLDDQISRVVSTIVSVCLDSTTVTTSASLRGALLRLLRQLLENSEENNLNHLLSKLDADLTAAFMTPIDRLKLREEFDSERDKIRDYCKQQGYENSLRRLLSSLVRPNYLPIEFARPEGSKFLVGRVNSAFTIELLAIFCVELQLPAESFTIELFSQLLGDLPDCDVKCVAILCAAKALNNQLEADEGQTNQHYAIADLCQLINGLADGDHSPTIREACCILLKLTLKTTMKFGVSITKLRDSLVWLLSALIKLSQDEDPDIRSICHKIILDLYDEPVHESNNCQEDTRPVVGSRLDKLIKLITTKLFNPNDEEQLNCCTDLLLRIVFNHANNYSSSNMIGDQSIDDETPINGGRLFDKTKLNTFADHVSIINSSINGLETFFMRRHQKIELNSIKIADQILDELKVIDGQWDEDSGDYSWRLRKIIKGSTNKTTDSGEATNSCQNNELIFERFLSNLLASFAYFSNGYTNMLMDTEYTYNELSLFRRVAFMRFVKVCTKFQLQDQSLMDRISQNLDEVIQRSCCTTLLYKCKLLIQ